MAAKAGTRKAREPTPASVLKKVAAVSDTNKALQKEVRAMAKIFAENQKVLASMYKGIGAVAGALEEIQKQSGRISVLEGDAKKIYAGMSQAGIQSGLLEKLAAQADRMQKEVAELQESGGAGVSARIDETLNAARNNSEMIIRIGKRLDKLGDGLREVSSRTGHLAGLPGEIEKMGREIRGISDRTGGLEAGAPEISRIREELAGVADTARSAAALEKEISAIRGSLDGISDRIPDTGPLASTVRDLGREIGEVSSRVGRAASLAPRIDGLEREIAGIAERQKEGMDDMRGELRQAGAAAGRAAAESSREVLALLELSRFEASVRTASESKYGGTSEISRMSSQTAAIISRFRDLAGRDIPDETVEWAVGRIFESADRWEVRFADAYAALSKHLGREALRGAVRTRQVRDIYGIRAVDEIRADLGIS